MGTGALPGGIKWIMCHTRWVHWARDGKGGWAGGKNRKSEKEGVLSVLREECKGFYLGENREKRGKAGKWREQFLLQKLQIIVTCLSGLGGLWPSNPAWDTLSTQAEEHTTLFIRKRGCKPEVRREDIH